VRGRLVIQLRSGDVSIGPGEFYVVPRGTPHNPVADEECWIVLVETVTTQHTGGVQTPLTRSIEEQLGG
jgi:mannose-6-phosphate isomerase-like protein (cupin superfamily)